MRTARLPKGTQYENLESDLFEVRAPDEIVEVLDFDRRFAYIRFPQWPRGDEDAGGGREDRGRDPNRPYVVSLALWESDWELLG